MGWLNQWRRRRDRRAKNFRPTLAGLETRVVPAGIASNFVNHGGAVLAQPQVELVFDGQAWNSNAGTQTQVQDFATSLLGSSFMDVLAQYGVGHGQVAGSVVLPDALGSTVTPLQIQDTLSRDIANGTIPQPGPNTVLFVLTPPNVSVKDNPFAPATFLGYHSSLFDNQGNQDAYAVVPYPGGNNPQAPGLNAFQSLTDTFSHELAEAATDPYVDANGNPSGWDDYGYARGDIFAGEIADLAENAPAVYLANDAVTQLWSNQADAVVAPAGATRTPGAGTVPAPTPAALTVTPPSLSAQAGTAFQGTVATVGGTDATAANLANLSATIDWGDGSGVDTTATVTTDAAGHVIVQGTHTYGSAGHDKVTVTVTDGTDQATASSQGLADVAAPVASGGLTATGVNVTAVTGQPFVATVATVSDPGAGRHDLVAKIDWGDGSWPSLVRLQGPDASGNFSVLGLHDYNAARSYTITVTVSDRATGDQATATATADVADHGPLSVTGQRIDATAGTSFTGTIATVTDPGASADGMKATVDWGDGSAPDTTATVTADGNGNLVVQGTHTYAGVGNYRVTVTVTDAAGNRDQAVSLADVDPAPVAPGIRVKAVDLKATAGQAFTDGIAAVYLPGAAAGDLTVRVNWGDGTTDGNAQLVPFGTQGLFVVNGTHTYAGAGHFTITVTVTGPATGATGSSSSTAFVAAAPTTPGTPTTTTTTATTGTPTDTTTPTTTDLGTPPTTPTPGSAGTIHHHGGRHHPSRRRA